MERLALTIPEAGQLLGVSRATAFRLAADGRLPVVTLGDRTRRVPVDALRRRLNAQALSPTPAATDPARRDGPA